MLWDLERKYKIVPFADKIVELIVESILELNNQSGKIQLDVTGHRQKYIGEKIFKVELLEKSNNEALIRFKVIYYFTDKYGYRRQAKPDEYIIKIVAERKKNNLNIFIRQKGGMGRATPEVICYYIDKKIAKTLRHKNKNLKVIRER